MKKISVFIISVLIAAMMPLAGAQAAGEENVVMTATDEKAKIEIHLPDDSGGVSTFRLRMKIEGDLSKLDKKNPLSLKVNEEVSAKLIETRFRAQDGIFTIYLSDTNKLTDKADFELGTISPNTTDESEFDLRISIPENGMDYMDGNGNLREDFSVISSAIALKVNADEGTSEENPEGTPEENPEGTPEETPEENPEGTPEEMPEENPEGTPEEMPEGTEGEISPEKEQTAEKADSEEEKDTVQTGDQNSFAIYFGLAGVSAAGIGSAWAFRRKMK